MITLASVAGTVAVLLTVITFIWRLRRERREVINRGVNQSPVLTWVCPLVYTLYRAVITSPGLPADHRLLLVKFAIAARRRQRAARLRRRHCAITCWKRWPDR